jgi:hypothetical protein
VPLDTFLGKHEGLIEALVPFAKRGFNAPIPMREAIDFMSQAFNIEPFREALADGVQLAKGANRMAMAPIPNHITKFLSVAERAASWERMAEHIKPDAWIRNAFRTGWYYLVSDYMELARNTPCWMESLKQEKHLLDIFNHFYNIDPDKEWHNLSSCQFKLVKSCVPIPEFRPFIPFNYIVDRINEFTRSDEISALNTFLGFIEQEPVWQRRMIDEGICDKIVEAARRDAHPEMQVLLIEGLTEIIPAASMGPKPLRHDIKRIQSSSDFDPT